MRAHSTKISLNLGIKTYLNGPLTSDIVVNASQVATDTGHYGTAQKTVPLGLLLAGGIHNFVPNCGHKPS